MDPFLGFSVVYMLGGAAFILWVIRQQGRMAENAKRDPKAGVRLQKLVLLGRSGDTAAVAMLAEVLKREKGELAAAAALALGATGDPAAEPPLLLALRREDTRMAATNALARVGSTAAVLPLKEAAKSAAHDMEIVRAASRAITEIQARLPGALPGQLSLSLSEAGKLSLAQAEAGRLALTTDHPAGHFSEELGAEGRGSLLEFAESEEDDTLSAVAVKILDRELPAERARDILFNALRMRRLLTAHACLETLGKSGDAAAVAVLAEVLKRENGGVAAAAALALGATGDPAAEPPLLPALRREDTRMAAVNALARVGSTAAVLPLKEVAKSAAHDMELVRAASRAIAEIQSRLQGASPGQLSLAQSEAGKLSLAQSEAGRLALATDPAGQLSLPPDETGRSSSSGTEGTLRPDREGAPEC